MTIYFTPQDKLLVIPLKSEALQEEEPIDNLNESVLNSEYWAEEEDPLLDWDEDWMDADALASAGFGTDEDYGG